ncbi:MAG: COX15/CtaA family protein [Myxococcota bacterium]
MRDEADGADEQPILRRLSLGFALLVGLTFVLVVLGALVRAHDAGLACPDWPLCFGQVIPAMNLEVAFEWSHRALAGTLSVVFLVLCTLALRDRDARERGGLLMALAAGLLAIQVLLGALTVWQLLASWTVTLHLLTGNAFAATLLLLALRLGRSGRSGSVEVTGTSRLLVSAAALLLGAQIALGGLVSSSFAGLACPEWPSCNGGSWYPSWRGGVGLHLLHRTNGYLLVCVLGIAALALRRPRPLARALLAAFGLSLLQVGVGVSNVLLGLPVEVTGLHSALAAALVLLLTFATHEAWSTAAATHRARLPGPMAEVH